MFGLSAHADSSETDGIILFYMNLFSIGLLVLFVIFFVFVALKKPGTRKLNNNARA